MSDNETRSQCIVRFARIEKADSRLDSASGHQLSIIWSSLIAPSPYQVSIRPGCIVLVQG